MLNVGGPELLIILLVALIFLGPQRLPDVARQLGQTLSSLRSLASGFQAEIDAASKDAAVSKAKAATEPDTSSSMSLDGPTDQAEAIAKTQTDAARRWTVNEPFQGSASTDTDALKSAARHVGPGGDVKPVSPGGPVDLTVQDDAPATDSVDPIADEEE